MEKFVNTYIVLLKKSKLFSKTNPTLKNADLDRVVDNTAEIMREAAGQVEVFGQMGGADRQAGVVLGWELVIALNNAKFLVLNIFSSTKKTLKLGKYLGKY